MNEIEYIRKYDNLLSESVIDLWWIEDITNVQNLEKTVIFDLVDLRIDGVEKKFLQLMSCHQYGDFILQKIFETIFMYSDATAWNDIFNQIKKYKLFKLEYSDGIYVINSNNNYYKGFLLLFQEIASKKKFTLFYQIINCLQELELDFFKGFHRKFKNQFLDEAMKKNNYMMIEWALKNYSYNKYQIINYIINMKGAKHKKSIYQLLLRYLYDVIFRKNSKLFFDFFVSNLNKIDDIFLNDCSWLPLILETLLIEIKTTKEDETKVLNITKKLQKDSHK